MTEGARTHADKASITWWTGSQTVNLRLSDLAPTWIVNGTSGPGSMVAGQMLIPVPGGIAAVSPSDGAVQRMIAVDRGETTDADRARQCGRDDSWNSAGDTLFALR